MSHPVQSLHAAVQDAAHALAGDGAPAAALERPRNPEHGDYATNAALMLAGGLRRPPRDVADALAAELRSGLGDDLESASVAGPGFLNLRLSDRWYARALSAVAADGSRYGTGVATAPEQINVEFVSANPTGPLHLGHARNAAVGDAIARILAFAGHSVTREYYINDYGTQVVNLGRSVQARARGEEVPEDGYKGDYVAALALEITDAATRPLTDVTDAAVALMVERIRAALHAFGVDFDVWFSERTLHEVDPQTGKSGVEHGFDVLAEHGHSYRSDGALWLRTTDFGDDKDRVLERSSGDHTYFASDIAYAQNKRERNFGRMIFILGADHHGYIGRMKASYQALGGSPDTLELFIMQFVHLVRDGQRVSMSKRSGEFITLSDLVEEIGVDAARWFLLNRSHDTAIEVDLSLASSASSENPVYYVQYAHARIAALLRRAGAERVEAASAAVLAGDIAASVPDLDPSERRLIAALLDWPQVVAEAAERRAPHRIATYALALAQAFSAFYRDCKVVGAEPAAREDLRLVLALVTQRTIAAALDLLGVSAPAEMRREDDAA